MVAFWKACKCMILKNQASGNEHFFKIIWKNTPNTHPRTPRRPRPGVFGWVLGVFSKWFWKSVRFQRPGFQNHTYAGFSKSHHSLRDASYQASIGWNSRSVEARCSFGTPNSSLGAKGFFQGSAKGSPTRGGNRTWVCTEITIIINIHAKKYSRYPQIK